MTAVQIPSDFRTDEILHPAKDSAWIDAVVGALVGLAAFFAFGFHHVLSPHHVDWLLYWSQPKDAWYYDPSSVYISWEFFRRAPWSFPLGLNPSYGLEFGSSIVFSDTIPLLAILFKPFSPWLGARFQYVGIWILACFILQGLFGGLLASKISRQRIPRLLLCFFFVTSPILIERAWTEYPLMGHWLILWAIYLYLADSPRRVNWQWMILGVLGAGTTFYFVPMVAAIWAAHALRKLMRNRRSAGWVAIEGAGCLGTLMLAMRIMGYNVLPFKSGATQSYGDFAINLLGPIDPWHWSTFLPPQDLAPNHLGEGFCYLGGGVLVLAVIAIVNLVRARISRQSLMRVFPLALALLALTCFAVSNKIAFGSHVLHIPLRQSIWFVAGIFRASCRMFWPVYYVLWLAFFHFATRNWRPWLATFVLAGALVVQIVDLAPLYRPMRERYVVERVWETPLKDGFWASVPQRYRQIVMVRSLDKTRWVPLAILGYENDIPTNCTLVTRYDYTGNRIVVISTARESSLRENRPDRQTLYIIPDDALFAEVTKRLDSRHGFGQIDGYNVIAPFWFSDAHAVGPGNLQRGPWQGGGAH